MGEILASLVSNPGTVPIWCSPLGRTRESCAIVCDAMGRSTATVRHDDRLMEVHDGVWEGLTSTEKALRDRGVYERYCQDKFRVSAPGGESFVDVYPRAQSWFTDCAPAGDMIVISHQIPIRMLIAVACDLDSEPLIDIPMTQDLIYVIGNGVSPEDSYWALRRKAIIVDVPERPVAISGPDATAFLEKIFARRIATLKEGRGRYAIACAHDGGLFMGGILFRLEQDRYWYVQPDGDLETWLLAHKAGLDVTVKDPHARALQVQGRALPAIMAAATGGAINKSFKYFHSGYFDVGGQQV